MYDAVQYVHGGKFTSRGRWRHPDRVIDTTELILVTQGSFRMHLGGTEYALRAGDVLRIDPDVRHGGIGEAEKVSFYWIHLRGIGDDPVPDMHSHPEGIARVELLCRQMLHYAGTAGYPGEVTDWLARVLLTELCCRGERIGTRSEQLYGAVCEWVRINSDLPLTTADVAVQFHYHADHLNRIFKQYYPAGLKAYISEMRMDRIRHDLLSDERIPLRVLAEKYGFGEYKYFLKFFRYHESVSPAQYRKLYSKMHTNNH